MMITSKGTLMSVILSAYASLKLHSEAYLPIQLMGFPCMELDGLSVRAANAAACELMGEDPTGRPFVALLDDNARRVWRRESSRRGGSRQEYLGETGILCRKGCVNVRMLLLRGRRMNTLVLSPAAESAKFQQPSAVACSSFGDVPSAPLNKAKDMLVSDELADLTHEMRTPLTVIRSAAVLLRERPEATEQYIQGIERNCERLQRVIGDILDLNRLDAAKCNVNQNELELCQWLRALLESLQAQAQCRGIMLRFSTYPAELNAVIDGDMLEHIVINLVSNALKFTPAGGLVDIKLEQSGKYALIIVSDTGSGIPPENLKRIFERHETGDARCGSGIGLSLAARYAVLLGGKLTAFSDGKNGSTFTLTLPINRGANLI